MHPPPRGARSRNRRHPAQRRDVAEAGGGEVRHVEAPHCLSDVSKRVALLVPVLRGIACGPDANAVEDDDRRTPHHWYRRSSRPRNPVSSSYGDMSTRLATSATVIVSVPPRPMTVAVSPISHSTSVTSRS